MTTAQKAYITIQKKLSEQRSEFNTLRSTETRSAEQDGRLTALDGELTDSETAFRTAADALLTDQATPAARIPKRGKSASFASGRTLARSTTPFSKSAARRTGQPPKRKRRTDARRIRSRLPCSRLRPRSGQ